MYRLSPDFGPGSDGGVDAAGYGRGMNLVKGLIKGAIVAKVIQVAQRELSKPENQRKIKDGLRKVTKAARR